MKTILVDAVFTFVSDEGVINEDLHFLLERFENPKLILTNAPLIRFEKYGLDKVPYPVFSLYNDPNKREPEYFKKMLGENDLTSDNVVYFEHNEEAVKSAQSVGITSYHFERGKQDLDKLREFLESNL